MIYYAQAIARYGVAGVLVFSSLTKWSNFHWFVGALRKYDLIRRGTEIEVAFGIASAELLIGGTLFVPSLLPWSAYAAMGLFIGFTVAICINLARGKFVECGCNGFWRKRTIGWQLVFRNVGFLGLTCLSVIAIGAASPVLRVYFDGFFLVSATLVMLPLIPKRVCHG